MLKSISLLLFSLTFGILLNAQEEFQTAKIFCDNAILQRGTEIPIKGTAAPMTKVTVIFNQNNYDTKSDKKGTWKVNIPATKAGGPYALEIKSGSKSIKYKNIFFGDVWLCSGQSNMEWVMANTDDAENEISQANDHLIRQFKVPHANADLEEAELPGGSWALNSPENTGRFTAVGYYFAKELRQSQNIPIGLLNSSWGGSRIEPWISKETLDANHPEYNYKAYVDKHNIDRKGQKEKIEKMFPGLSGEDIGMVNGKPIWSDPSLSLEKWTDINVENFWENQGFNGVDGIAYYRVSFNLDEEQLSKDLVINLGAIDDSDKTWFNGKLIGKTDGYQKERKYTADKSLNKRKNNILLIRVNDTGGGGGLYASKFKQYIQTASEDISLSDLDWKFRFSAINVNQLSNQIPNIIYNAMIHPIIDFPIKGVIWYQGESNAGDLQTAYDYRYHLKTLIEEWRNKWNQSDLPFFYVQLANFKEPKNVPSNDGWAVIRESMNEVLKVPNTGQAVIIDIGEAKDIHPRNKRDVGYRLALPARKIVYGEDVIKGSPMYDSHVMDGNKVVLTFKDTDTGLMTKDKYGYVKGFSIAGADKKFVWAQAKIDNGKIKVWNSSITNPVAVRYAWEINPSDANVFSKKGLPLTPFRTDDWEVRK